MSTTVTVEKVKASIVEWKASPANYQGTCPATINFSGKISVDYYPTYVHYTFIRSDGAIPSTSSSGLVSSSKRRISTRTPRLISIARGTCAPLRSSTPRNALTSLTSPLSRSEPNSRFQEPAGEPPRVGKH